MTWSIADDHGEWGVRQAERSTGRKARSVIERGPRPTPTIPDCTNSRMPYGSSTFRRASNLSDDPVASMVTASVATSTTFARKSSAVWRTWGRVSGVVRTFTNNSSRCTDWAGSSSTILSTLTSLFSCLVTCSRGESSTSTTTVMRETPTTSVGPTASDSMLKARRENSVEIRARTPGLSSTRTDRVCLLISPAFFGRSYPAPRASLLTLPGRSYPRLRPPCPRKLGRTGRPAPRSSLLALPVWSHPPSDLDLVVTRTGCDHWPDHRVPADREVHHDGTIIDSHRLLDRRVHILGAVTAQPDAAVGLGEFDEVRNAAAVQIGIRVTPVVEQGLPLPDHAQALVVDHGHLDRNALDRTGGEFLVGHLKTSIAVDRPHCGVGTTGLRAHGRRHGIPHRAQATGVDPGPRIFVRDELRRPHLMLTDPGDVDRLRPRDRAQPLDHVLRRQFTI